MLVALWEKTTHCPNYSIYIRKKKHNTAWRLLEPGVLSQLYIVYNNLVTFKLENSFQSQVTCAVLWAASLERRLFSTERVTKTLYADNYQRKCAIK